MQEDDHQGPLKKTPSPHPDSKYDNWTIRSYDVTTKYEDIPQWLKMYAESSIDTHDFFKFVRFEYDELDAWQKMLLKLYREDLRRVIKYYDDFRASLVQEIMVRSKSEAEQVSSDLTERHPACQPINQLEVDLVSSPGPAEGPSLAPPVTPLSLSPGITFKRFGKQRSSSKGETQPPPPLSEAGSSANQGSVSDDVTPPIPDEPCVTSQPLTSQPLDVTSEGPTSCSTGNGGFESPKLERVGGKRKIKGKLSFECSENVDQNNRTTDFPTPRHFRSASTRHASMISDFPSPLLARSKSDRTDRYSAHVSLLHGVYRNSASSFNTLDSDDSSSFSRTSGKQGRRISSPKMKVKTEPGSKNIAVIPETNGKPKKVSKTSKLLSRAASFGRRDKSKGKAGDKNASPRDKHGSPRDKHGSPRDKHGSPGDRGPRLNEGRKSRKEQFAAVNKKDSGLPKETAV